LTDEQFNNLFDDVEEVDFDNVVFQVAETHWIKIDHWSGELINYNDTLPIGVL
jgi:hypothetical protein